MHAALAKYSSICVSDVVRRTTPQISGAEMSEPAVSVIIPCYRASSTIRVQLEALSDQIDAPPFEVLLVDNDPTQLLEESARHFANSEAFTLRVVPAHEHRGSSYARNVGIAHARARALQFCDADDIVSRTWVRNGFLTTQRAELWTGGSVLLRDEDFENGISSARQKFDDPPPAWSEPASSRPGHFPVLMGGNFGGKRATLTALGGFDQSFAHYGDDNDLAFRARRAGHALPDAGCVMIGYRGKWSFRERWHRGFHDARARRRLLIVHGVAEASPMRSWPLDIAGCAAASILMLFRRGVAAEDIAMRWSHALGNASGSLRFGWPRRPPASTPGLGLSTSRGEEARR